MKKTLIATATAGLIAAGAMIGTTSTASATSLYFGGPGWSLGIGDGHHYSHHMRECRPVFKTVRWSDDWGRPHFKQVFLGRDCGGGPRWGGPGPNLGWGYH